MSVKITDNTARVENEVGNGMGLAIRWMLEDIYVNATPPTPMRTGDLRKRVLRRMDGNFRGAITWDSSYAAVQEQGYRNSKNGRVYFKNYTTPDTGAHYAENAVKKVADKLPEYLEKAGVL